MTATVSVRAFTGTGAGTMSSPQTGITLTNADALSGGPVVPGSVSYERWIALRVDTAPVTGVTNLSVTNTGSLPTGVSIRFGVTDTARTPINTASPIATMELTSGRRFIFDTGIYGIGQVSRYLVLQEVVANGAPSGAVPQHALTFGFAES